MWLGVSAWRGLTSRAPVCLAPLSRQLAVYGRETMRRLAGARVLVVGANGLGVEVGACPCLGPGHPALTPTRHSKRPPWRAATLLACWLARICALLFH